MNETKLRERVNNAVEAILREEAKNTLVELVENSFTEKHRQNKSITMRRSAKLDHSLVLLQLLAVEGYIRYAEKSTHVVIEDKGYNAIHPRENAGAALSEPAKGDDDLVTVSYPERKEIRRHKVPCPPWMTEKSGTKKQAIS